MPTETTAPTEISDGAALDSICAVLNRTSSGADAFQAIAALVADTGRPYIDDTEDITTDVDTGDYGLDYATVRAGNVTVTVYQSLQPPHGITVDIATETDGRDRLAVTLNDGPLWERTHDTAHADHG